MSLLEILLKFVETSFKLPINPAHENRKSVKQANPAQHSREKNQNIKRIRS
ncbi:hypothetical protein RYX36_017967, partial [Vicia faba]